MLRGLGKVLSCGRKVKSTVACCVFGDPLSVGEETEQSRVSIVMLRTKREREVTFDCELSTVDYFQCEELRVICGARGVPGTVAPFRAWRGSRDLVAQSPKLHAPAVAHHTTATHDFSTALPIILPGAPTTLPS